MVFEGAERSLEIDVVQLGRALELARNSLEFLQVDFGILFENASAHGRSRDVVPSEATVENLLVLSEEANVLLSVRDDLVDQVAVFLLRGVFFALNHLDARLHVPLGVNELRCGVEEKYFLGRLRRDVVDDDLITDSNLQQVVTNIHPSRFILSDGKLRGMRDFGEVGAVGIRVGLHHDFELDCARG